MGDGPARAVAPGCVRRLRSQAAGAGRGGRALLHVQVVIPPAAAPEHAGPGDLLRLLESLRSADGLELVRGTAERMLQELIEAGATARIGAGRNEHTETRTVLRNGHHAKTLSTQAGDLDLAIPELRSGASFPHCWNGALIG
jgi:hypothetical protein